VGPVADFARKHMQVIPIGQQQAGDLAFFDTTHMAMFKDPTHVMQAFNEKNGLIVTTLAGVGKKLTLVLRPPYAAPPVPVSPSPPVVVPPPVLPPPVVVPDPPVVVPDPIIPPPVTPDPPVATPPVAPPVVPPVVDPAPVVPPAPELTAPPSLPDGPTWITRLLNLILDWLHRSRT
jgi:hypothetical protein